MKISRLTVKNLLSFRDETSTESDQHLNILVGVNGGYPSRWFGAGGGVDSCCGGGQEKSDPFESAKAKLWSVE